MNDSVIYFILRFLLYYGGIASVAALSWYVALKTTSRQTHRIAIVKKIKHTRSWIHEAWYINSNRNLVEGEMLSRTINDAEDQHKCKLNIETITRRESVNSIFDLIKKTMGLSYFVCIETSIEAVNIAIPIQSKTSDQIVKEYLVEVCPKKEK